MQEKKKERLGVMAQGKLDGQFVSLSVPKVFTREGILQAVTRHIVCDDQVGS
jgi:hypothetical protein